VISASRFIIRVARPDEIGSLADTLGDALVENLIAIPLPREEAEAVAEFGLRQMIGNVWEWTASTFLPYPGFLRDPYQEYSEPWFGTHKVLRGGSFATPPRVVHGTFRNFYTPERADIFAGFRTCAL